MLALDIAPHRLYNQRIAQEKFELPSQAVAWLGAMQAQDYASAKWAVGLRCEGATEGTIEQAIVDKKLRWPVNLFDLLPKAKIRTSLCG